jgi:hypothetical protein
MTRRLLFILVSASLACVVAWARPQDEYTRIARVSYIEGHASFQHTSDVDWTAASVNLPLEPGDRIYTGLDGRVEIQFDDGSVCRLAENTDLEILSLREELIQLRLLVGLSTLTVSRDVDFEIDTPAAAFNTLRPGVYRFDVVENGDSDAIVRKGELEAANNEFSRRIQSGELLHASRGMGDPAVSRYIKRDQWDEWNDRRDADMNAYASRKYLPTTVYLGVSELDRYGRWIDVDTYGTAWVPYSVDTYWSPYSIGRWCYRPFYGWTWVSYEPWGWLPYHYGRWYQSASFGWCWLPGPAFAFNFWSPALVSFYSGPGWISWCPLGPGDYYNANNYHYNHGIFGHQLHELMALQTRGPGDLFHRNSRGAFRTTQIEHFRNGSFNGRSASARWDGVSQPWREGTLVRDRLTVQPTATSFGAAPDRPSARPSGNSALPVVVRTNPRVDAGNQQQFTRITNPQIPTAPSRTRQNRNEPGATDTGTRPNGRGGQVPQTERQDQGTRNNFANTEQGGRNPASPRWTVTPQNSEGQTGKRVDSAPVVQPESGQPSNQQNAPRPRYQRITPDSRPTQQASPVPRQNTQGSIQNSFVEPRSSGGSWNSSNQGAAPSRVTGGSDPTYRAPTYRAPTYNAPTPGAPAYRAPTYSAPTPSAPAFSAPRQFNPPSERSGSGGVRSFAPPSSGNGGFSRAPSSGGSSGGSFSGHSSGGSGAQHRDHSSGGKGK